MHHCHEMSFDSVADSQVLHWKDATLAIVVNEGRSWVEGTRI